MGLEPHFGGGLSRVVAPTCRAVHIRRTTPFPRTESGKVSRAQIARLSADRPAMYAPRLTDPDAKA